MVVDPGPIPVMSPELDTVATEELAEDHLTALFPALEGRTVATMNWVLPIPTDVLLSDTDTEETATVIDMEHDAVNTPHRAVITTDPNPIAVMVPDSSTVAFAELDVHTTVLLVAFAGKTVATRVNVFPGCMVALV
jgi:hypothetical protein